MSYKRKIRIEYYQVVKARKDGSGRDIVFDLETLILKANGLNLEDRTYDYYQEKARLDKLKYHKASECYYLNFVRLRQTKIPVKAKINKESTPIPLANDEYIGEDVSAVYDKCNHIIALQRNRDSLSSSGIEYYLTELFNSSDYGIYLRTIPFSDIDKKLKKAKGYRKITMRLATNKANKINLPDKSSFKKLLSFTDPYDGMSVTITMSMGRHKGTMDGDTITDTIKDIQESDGFVTAAEVGVKYNDVDPVDTIDLFSSKYHSFISVQMEELQSLDFIDVCDEIRGKYLENRDGIIESISNN